MSEDHVNIPTWPPQFPENDSVPFLRTQQNLGHFEIHSTSPPKLKQLSTNLISLPKNSTENLRKIQKRKEKRDTQFAPLIAFSFLCLGFNSGITVTIKAMNGDGDGDGDVKMEENEGKEKVVLMWGYLPGALPQRSPLLSPTIVRPAGDSSDHSWRDVFGGGCGFAMAISGALFHLCVGLFLASGNLSF